MPDSARDGAEIHAQMAQAISNSCLLCGILIVGKLMCFEVATLKLFEYLVFWTVILMRVVEVLVICVSA